MESSTRRAHDATQSGDISIVLNVISYSVRVYPGRSSVAPQSSNYAGTDLGYMILMGTAATTPPNLQVSSFFVHFVPDGLTFPVGGYAPREQAVEIAMNWSQFHPLLNLLKTATSVQAIFSLSGGLAWADVEGQFTRNEVMNPDLEHSR